MRRQQHKQGTLVMAQPRRDIDYRRVRQREGHEINKMNIRRVQQTQSSRPRQDWEAADTSTHEMQVIRFNCEKSLHTLMRQIARKLSILSQQINCKNIYTSYMM